MQDHYVKIPATDKPRIVIIGGGFAGIKFIKKLRNAPFQLVLFDRNNYHTFQPLLYQVATAGLEPDSIADPLRKQLEPARNFYFRMAVVNSINLEASEIETEIGKVKFDHLVIATGSKTNYYGNESIIKHGFPLKQIPQALDLRSHLLQNFEKATITRDQKELVRKMNVVIVGGGPTGTEVAGAIGELKRNILPADYPELDFSRMRIILLEGSNRLLNGMSDRSGERALKYLKKFDVDVRLNTFVDSFDGKHVKLKGGVTIDSETLIWAAGVKGNFPDGLPENSINNSRIKVDQFHRVLGTKEVYALGDVSEMANEQFTKGHPMLAPVAIQQGENLGRNFIARSKNRKEKPFTYADKGAMATIGRNKAVADLGNLKFGGLIAWLIWMFVHLFSIIGFRNKLVVFINWVWNYFTYDKGTRLIIRKFVPGNKHHE